MSQHSQRTQRGPSRWAVLRSAAMMIVAAMGGTYVSLGFDLTTVDGVIQWGIVVTTEITLTSVMIARGVDQVAEREAARRRAERLARSEDETMVIRTAWTS